MCSDAQFYTVPTIPIKNLTDVYLLGNAIYIYIYIYIYVYAIYIYIYDEIGVAVQSWL